MVRKDHKIKKISLAALCLWVTGSIIILCGVGWVVFQSHYEMKNQSAMRYYLNIIQSWITERQHHLHQKLIKVKHISTAKPQEEHLVHFEFYTDLPNMQIAGIESAVSHVPQKTADSKLPVQPSMQPMMIVSADELERELADQIKIVRGVRKN
jgi:hypothetical protein